MLETSATGTGGLLRAFERDISGQGVFAAVSAAPDAPGGTPAPLLTPLPQDPSAVIPNRGLPTTGSASLIPSDASGASFANWQAIDWIAFGVVVAVVLLLTIVAVASLLATLSAWRTVDRLRETGFSAVVSPPRHSFTLVVPAQRTGQNLAHTIAGLAAQHHGRFEVVAVVADDDLETLAAARESVRRHPGIVSVIVHDGALSKPMALNLALESARGDVVGVFEADAEANPNLLQLVDSRLTETGIDAIQVGVQTTNLRSNWWSLQFVLDSYFWYRSRLPAMATAGLVPLTGNSVFVRREWLEFVGGWNPDSVAEDSGLSSALAAAGARIDAVDSPDVVTRTTVGGTLRVGIRRQSMRYRTLIRLLRSVGRREQVRGETGLARWLLTLALIEPVVGVIVLAVAVIAVITGAPVLIVGFALVPVAVLVLSGVVRLCGLAEFGALYDPRVRLRDYARLTFGAIPHLLVRFAALVFALRVRTQPAAVARTVAEERMQPPMVAQTVEPRSRAARRVVVPAATRAGDRQ